MEAGVRPLPKMVYASPSSLKEALGLLKKYKNKARLLAGGTDLIPKMKKRMIAAEVVIDLNRIPGLSGIKLGRDGLHIGGLTRLNEIKESLLVGEKCLPPPSETEAPWGGIYARPRRPQTRRLRSWS
jgi:4-hydroxybenzoyl-CoA reductase subunit beta